MRTRPHSARPVGLGALVAALLATACTPTSGTPSSGEPPTSASGSAGTTAGSSGGATSGAESSGATSSSTSASTATSAAGTACVERLARSLTGAERAGQLLMVAITPGEGLTPVTRQIAAGSVGGVIYLGGWSSGRSAIRATSRQLQDAAGNNVDLFVAADQEGGQIQQLTGPGFSAIPSATEQGRLSPAALTEAAAGWARELAGAGVNVDLAPVADTVPADVGTTNGPIGAYHREYGSTPGAVGPDVAAFVAGMHKGGVAATLKHFPGIGRIQGNTDTTAGGITDSVATVSDPFLEPFAAGMAAGADFVMVSTARYPRIDPDDQAIFSAAIVTDLLRGRMGWDGVVITDDVGAARSVAAVPVADRATRFVAAGGDIVLTARAGDIPTMHRALIARAADPAFADRMNAAVIRVLTLKTARGLTVCSRP